jgi:hypothetical protein
MDVVGPELAGFIVLLVAMRCYPLVCKLSASGKKKARQPALPGFMF